MSTPEFDQFAESYDADLQRALSTSGEDKDFFAKGRIDWMRARLKSLGFRPQSVVDYGCGTGTAAPFLLSAGISEYLGVDISPKSIEVAKATLPHLSRSFRTLEEYQPSSSFDLAYTNGVFHHIPVADRPGAVRYVFETLKSGGYFAFWENNPWNPGTRYVMSNCAFDHDAITLAPPESRRLLKSAGFEIVGSDFLFFFPKILKWLRFLESSMAKLPLGGQYLVLCRRPLH